MWPWGHLAFGYLLYSLSTRLVSDESPVGGPTLLLAVATQIPDLVDKPLSWAFDVFNTGYGAGHSVFVAVPAIAVAAVLAHRVGRERYGLAFGVGYASHLAADVLLGAVLSGEVSVEILLWPFSDFEEYGTDMGFFDRFSEYFVTFVAEVLAGEAGAYVVLYLVLFTTVLAVWVYDGLPVVREAKRWLWDQSRADGGRRRDR